MRKPDDLEDDLEALDAFLMSDQTPDDCMMLSDLDGFLTAVAIGPEFIAPSEWLSVIWGGPEGPIFRNNAHAQSILGAIMNHYNAILERFADGVFEPIFMESHEGHVISSDWAESFCDAIKMRPDAWEKLLTSESHFDCAVPILALCCDEKGGSLLELSEEAEDAFFAAADQLIPECVFEIAEFWRAASSSPGRPPASGKVSRNDPCPCGSGMKFKKCCGARQERSGLD